MLDPVTFLTTRGVDIRSLSLPDERLILTIERLKLLDFVQMPNDKTDKFYAWLKEQDIKIDFYLNAVLKNRYDCVIFTDNIEKLEDILMLFKLSTI